MSFLAAAAVLATPTIADFLKDKGTTAQQGLFTTHASEESGGIFLEVPKEGAEVLYVSATSRGLGSNDIGLDRGRLAAEHLLQLRPVGGKVLFEAQNTTYRALDGTPSEQRAVRQSFASSVLWAGAIKAQSPTAYLIDLTPFVVRDAAGVADTIRGAGEGSASLDGSRSVFEASQTLSFPDNLELEATLTFRVSGAGGQVSSVTPDSDSVTVGVHHSFVRLPDDGFEPIPFDPRTGFFSISFQDYASPITDPLTKKWIVRHRMDEPLIYYVDNGAPEPVRSALVEGAQWWAQAFAEAGHRGKYQVKVLPEDAHPLDARYNVIQWVHRSTRGWSYGRSFVDPRTGEIIKGHVSLGSLRVRQDLMIFEGLFGARATGTGGPNDPKEISLARLRQLSAHEVGHTLGVAHNFAGSTQNRSSVMDYPAPTIIRNGDSLSAQDAYDVGIGEWDKAAINWGYGKRTEIERRRLADQMARDGLLFLTDQDSRSPGSADPRGALWDVEGSALEGLAEVVQVRELALANFGKDRLAPGRPLSELKDVFVPIYLYHRYQVEAAAKLIGGVHYQHKVNGGPASLPEPVSAEEQEEAIAALLDCLDPEFLHIPDEVERVLVPNAFGDSNPRERFPSETSPTFDTFAAQRAAADTVLQFMLNAQRLTRMERQGLIEPRAYLGRIVNASSSLPAQELLVRRLMLLEASADLSPLIRKDVRAVLAGLQRRALGDLPHQIEKFLNRPYGTAPSIPPAPRVPPGSPIGMDCCHG